MTSPLSGVDATYLEALQRQFRKDPLSVDPSWRIVFELIDDIEGPPGDGSSRLAAAIRERGHLVARLDPLASTHAENGNPGGNGLGLQVGLADGRSWSADAFKRLESLYTGSLTIETSHIDDLALRAWSHEAFEALPPAPSVGARRRALDMLLKADEFERFLSVKFPTKKRFGIEGAEALLALLDRLLADAVRQGITDVLIGSMHRGRLNVMANLLEMPLAELLSLIAGSHPLGDSPDRPTADVPYHLGVTGKYGTSGMTVTLLPNPSHLEAIDPVLLGRTRARQDKTVRAANVLGILLHTDASVIGQGLVAETVQLSGLAGYSTAGTIHIVVNNQIGFTTEPQEARTSRYCTGAWKAIDSLLIHVNGDDVDATLRAAELAGRFRQEQGRDAVIDLSCYRRNGHNELDEPRFTQSRIYEAIDNHTPVTETYPGALISAGLVGEAELQAMRRDYQGQLASAFEMASKRKAIPLSAPSVFAGANRPANGLPTGVDATILKSLIDELSTVPDQLEAHAKVRRLVEQRREAIEKGAPWALGEALAFGTLILEGIPVRLSGQDTERGAFSHRHLAIHDHATGRKFVSLDNLKNSCARFTVINSPLSEYAVLGFEYGYSVESPEALVLWEAQFGDFANGAQIVLDQFISSGREKWQEQSSLVLLLPHGLEGQGPEHSSARPERLLQLAAGDNLRIVQPSTPANNFHLLRSQALSPDRRPLIVLSPKTLLRLPAALSPLADFETGTSFRPVIVQGPQAATHLLLCSGKLAYDLEKELALRGADSVAVVRLEQIYPFPEVPLLELIEGCRDAHFAWIQEEPLNAGLWSYLDRKLEQLLLRAGARHPDMLVISRPECASPAGSFHADHSKDQDELVSRAMAWCSSNVKAP
jgi:2-oxoglutarate dehydrogenase E1 component